MHDGHLQQAARGIPQQPHGAGVPRPLPEALHVQVLRNLQPSAGWQHNCAGLGVVEHLLHITADVGPTAQL